MTKKNNPIQIDDSGIVRTVQLVNIIGSGGDTVKVTNGGLDVNIQDQNTDAIIAYFNQVTNSTTITIETALDDTAITVADSTGAVIGSYIIIFNADQQRFTTFFATSVSGNIINLDGPLDVVYPVGTFVDIAIVDLSVDGTVTPQVFGLRGTTVPPGSVPIEFDLTRIMFQMVTDSPVSFGLFGNLPELSKGLFMRKRDGRYKNIVNFKTNDDIAQAMFDYDVFVATNPAQGVDGFKARLTFAGQNKVGVTIRLGPGEDAEWWVQDDLSGITRFRILAEGHIVE